MESLLSTGIFRGVAAASPAALRLALSPPLAVEDVAAAAVAGAAGLAQGTLGNHDAIKAASKDTGPSTMVLHCNRSLSFCNKQNKY